MCRVSMFCCGCSLRSGAITALVLTAISAVVNLVNGIQYLSAADTFEKQRHNDAAKQLRISAAVAFVSCALLVIIFVCLLLAILKNRAGLILPWLICAMISIVLTTIFAILALIAKNYVALVSLAVLAFFIYLWIVVLNFYRQLKDGTVVHTGKV